MKQALAFGTVALLLAGCVTSIPDRTGPAPLPIPAEVDSVRYQTGPCFGACPVYAVTVRANGTGTFEGKRFTAVTGERKFTLTPEQYDAFLARLAPYRPATGSRRYAPGEPGCDNAATDMPSVEVTWTRSLGDSMNLYVYFGCDMEKNRAMADALRSAPDALPIGELIGKQP